jgi:predicted cupin superfamily sugar epimerase
MHSRVAELIRILGLRPHPEGGHYTQVYLSSRRVRPLGRDVERPSLTTIYFLLAAGEHSRWHRVLSDEVWHYYEGDPLELLRFDDQGLNRVRLGPVTHETRPVAIIPADSWQAARPMGAYTLVGCTVCPGFDFDDFALAAHFPDVAARIGDAGADLARLI